MNIQDKTILQEQYFADSVRKAKHFVTLTFSDNVDRIEAEARAKKFHHAVSIAIAGNDARKSKYTHPMTIFIEKKERFHLHILMNDLPLNYSRLNDDYDLQKACSQIWSKLRYKNPPSEQRLKYDRKRLPTCLDELTRLAVEHSSKYFQRLSTNDDRAEVLDYLMKTYHQQKSDLFVPTYNEH